MEQGIVSVQNGQLERILSLAFTPVVALSELIKNASDACLQIKDTITVCIDTHSRMISVRDNGSGLSLEDIKNLCSIGYSDKMRDNNNKSAIGEPYAGSKGLGILTAFNLCDELELTTHSIKDKCSYRVNWKAGTNTINYEILTNQYEGTLVLLRNVSEENIKMLTLEEELRILYMTSINYYVSTVSLPIIKIYVDGVLKSGEPEKKIEDLYISNKKAQKNRGYFVSKASFVFSNDILTMSYEDNIENAYTFENEKIDLKDINSLMSFLKRKRININRYREQFIKLNSLDVKIDAFEGVYYIWREKKNEQMYDYSSGVKIYVNNYGLYKYLENDFDWLAHSEISQNKKASNFKLKNTFGYISIKDYNETSSGMKISKDRSDFEGNLARKKFYIIMREFISGIYSDIDINIKKLKNDEDYTFKLRNKNRYVVLGDILNIQDLISTDLLLNEFNIEYDEDRCEINANGDILFNHVGEYHFTFRYEDKVLDSKVMVKDPAPSFQVKKKQTVEENNSFYLPDLIIKNRLQNIEIHDIEISSDDVFIKNNNLIPDNLPGRYTVFFKYNDPDNPLCQTSEIIIKSKHFNEANRIRKLFGEYSRLKGYDKVKEIIDGIASCYVTYPTLCMIGLRVLTEILLKDFFANYYIKFDYDNDGGLPSKLSSFLSKAYLTDKQNILKRIVDKSIQDKYATKLTGKAKKGIEKEYENLELNLFIHNPEFKGTSFNFRQSLNIMLPVFNFIIEALLFIQNENHD